MAIQPLPSPELLRKLLDYNPQTGALTWRERPSEMFTPRKNRWGGIIPAESCARSWNRLWAGKPALDCIMTIGYRHGSLCGRRHTAHRVVWAWWHGEWPTNCIDHLDGDRANNRIDNLRDTTIPENQKNQKTHTRNGSGRMGVSWDKHRHAWRAFIGVTGKTAFLGRFGTYEEAVAARKAAEAEYGYHSNHGR